MAGTSSGRGWTGRVDGPGPVGAAQAGSSGPAGSGMLPAVAVGRAYGAKRPGLRRAALVDVDPVEQGEVVFEGEPVSGDYLVDARGRLRESPFIVVVGCGVRGRAGHAGHARDEVVVRSFRVGRIARVVFRILRNQHQRGRVVATSVGGLARDGLRYPRRVFACGEELGQARRVERFPHAVGA